MLFILSQVFGFIALITAVISVQIKDKTKLLFLQNIENIMKISALFFVGGLAGAYAETVGLARKMWFYKNSLKKKKNSIYSLIFFLSLAAVVGIITWQGPIGLFPISAVMLGTYGLWQDNIYILRYIAIFASINYAIYAVAVGAYTNAISEVFMIVSVIISLIRFNIQEKDDASKTLKLSI